MLPFCLIKAFLGEDGAKQKIKKWRNERSTEWDIKKANNEITEKWIAQLNEIARRRQAKDKSWLDRPLALAAAVAVAAQVYIALAFVADTPLSE